MTDIRLGLLETASSTDGVNCSDLLCNNVINKGDRYFKNMFDAGKALCFQCGICIRYHRKKAAKRGENIEKIIS